ncbi:hypothetical protein PH5382_00607 [Phaeobacter sp. CECT 5382]|nr:hypothetical protein PH5382_00607 [Phaeobacter sp. CECT 5382]
MARLLCLSLLSNNRFGLLQTQARRPVGRRRAQGLWLFCRAKLVLRAGAPPWCFQRSTPFEHSMSAHNKLSLAVVAH